MDQASELRKRADKCLAMAAEASDENLRAELHQLSKQWLELAAERERFLRIMEDLNRVRDTRHEPSSGGPVKKDSVFV